MLAAAAARAHSVTEVLRLLGVRVSGGSHAHISRQLKRFDIDTSHFTGSAHNRGQRGARRTTSAQLLAQLPFGARRTPGTRLKWALGDIGVSEECEECGVGPVWRGRPLTLHVDHINGDFLDNRPPNLRMLCPNCHSQTDTFAGRNRYPEERVTERCVGAEAFNPNKPDRTAHPLSENEEKVLIMGFAAGRLTAHDAARLLNCRLRQVYRLRDRLQETGNIAPRRRGPKAASSEIPPGSSSGPAGTPVRLSNAGGSGGNGQTRRI